MVVPKTGDKKQHTKINVKGELYEVSESVINDLDHIEGHPDFFTRTRTLVRVENSLPQVAYAYVISPNKRKEVWYRTYVAFLKPILNGIWNKKTVLSAP